MEARVQKWGNSLALRIPRALAGDLGLEENTPVHLERVGQQLIVTPAAAPRLAALLAQITPENLHDEVETGAAQGQELW